jgi:hypothetical protein
MKFQYALITIFIIITILSLSARFRLSKLNLKKNNVQKAIINNHAAFFKLEEYRSKAKAFTLSNQFNNQYFFLIDMKIHSGQKRFFVCSLKNDSILISGLVTHGSGSNISADSLQFSNAIHSNSTSLGRYKIGKPYYGKFGLAYKLYGLDTSNSNAYNRFVVLHAHPCVPEKEIAPLTICESWGCPTVSIQFLDQLQTFIDNSTLPVLLMIVY